MKQKIDLSKKKYYINIYNKMVDYYKKYLKYKKKYLELKKKGGMSSELAKKLNERLAKQNESWRHKHNSKETHTGDKSNKLRPIPEPNYQSKSPKQSPKQSPKKYMGDASSKLRSIPEPGYDEKPKSSPNKRTKPRKIESTADRKRRRKQKKIEEELKKLEEEKANKIERQESLTNEDLDAEPVNIGENLSPEDSKKLTDCFKKAGDDDLSDDCKKFIKEKSLFENL